MAVYLPVWKLTLHKSQVHSYSVVSGCDELAVHTCPLLCLKRRVAKVTSRLLCCWFSLRNNSMATNLQRFTLYSGSRRFVAWDCWTHTSWQLMQQDSDMLIAVSHVHLCFVKWSMSESVAILPQNSFRVFIIHLLNLQNLRGVLILVSLSVVVSTCKSA